MSRAPNRIHIIGGPGTGKSTLAREIGARRGLPVHDLDLVAFEPPHFIPRPRSQRLAEVKAIAEQPRWITEGIFLRWTQRLFDCADLIIWLDYLPWRVAMARILIRFARGGLKEARIRPAAEKFTRLNDYARNGRQLAQVFRSSWRYYHAPAAGPAAGDFDDRRADLLELLAAHRGKLVHCRESHDLSALMQDFFAEAQE